MEWKTIATVLIIIFAIGLFAPSDDVSEGDEPSTNGESLENVEVVELQKPEFRLISSNEVQRGTASELEATVQNTGEAGEVYLTLWFGPEAPRGELPDTIGRLRELGYEKARTITAYYNSGERRTISITEEPPADKESYTFYGFARTYTAVIENDGEPTTAEVSLKWKGDQETAYEVKSKTVPLQQGSNEIEFRVEEHPEFHHSDSSFNSWNVDIEPAS